MDLVQISLDAVTRSTPFPSVDEAPPPEPGDPDPSISVLNRDRRESERLASRLHEHHPDVSLARISMLIAQATDELAEARVQSFKMILVERAVLGRLTVRP